MQFFKSEPDNQGKKKCKWVLYLLKGNFSIQFKNLKSKLYVVYLRHTLNKLTPKVQILGMDTDE